jgi:hypothetical protein
MRKRLLHRRTILRGAGGAAVALPVLDAMLTLTGRLPGRAHAASPRRLVIFYTGSGFPMAEWRPVRGTSASDFKLSKLLTPLAPIQRNALFIEGVPMSSSFDSRQRAQGHPAGTQAVLTGAWAGEGSAYGGNPGVTAGFSPFPSIDHLIGKAVGGSTRFPALYFGTASGMPTPAARPFVAESQIGIGVQSDPGAMFDELFANFTPASGMTAAAVASAAARRAEDRRVVLDAVMGDARALRCRLGNEDRQRLDQHLTSVGELQKRVSTPSTTTPMGCAKPQPMAFADRTFVNAKAITTTQLDLMAMALACDRTRVAAFSLGHGDANSSHLYRWLGHDADHHYISHLRGVDPRGRMTQIGAWHAEQLAGLAARLKAVVEPDGTLFDNTVILWVSECGDGWTHDRKKPAFMLFTGGQSYFKTGRYLDYASASGITHSRLLLHLMHYMGVQAPAVGPTEYNQGGPLPLITTA